MGGGGVSIPLVFYTTAEKLLNPFISSAYLILCKVIVCCVIVSLAGNPQHFRLSEQTSEWNVIAGTTKSKIR